MLVLLLLLLLLPLEILCFFFILGAHRGAAPTSLEFRVRGHSQHI